MEVDALAGLAQIICTHLATFEAFLDHVWHSAVWRARRASREIVSDP